MAYLWQASRDGGLTWEDVGHTASDYPGPTGAPGILLRSTASFADPTNPANTLIAPSSPVRYILGTAADEQLVGGDLPTFIFAGGGDDVITAGTGLLRAFGGEGNDRFLAVTGDGGAIYDGQAGINTYDMSVYCRGRPYPSSQAWPPAHRRVPIG